MALFLNESFVYVRVYVNKQCLYSCLFSLQMSHNMLILHLFGIVSFNFIYHSHAKLYLNCLDKVPYCFA